MGNKYWKKVMALGLSLVMLMGILAGCGGGSKAEDAQKGTDVQKTESQDTAAVNVSDAEIPVVKIPFPKIVELTNMDAIIGAVNEILVEETGCKMELIVMDFANYAEEMNLILSSSENEVDVFHTLWRFDVSTLANNGQILCMDDYIDQYGQGIKDVIDEKYLDCGRINGKLYSLPVVTAYSDMNGYILRKDIADEIGVDPASVKTLADLSEVLYKVEAVHPELDTIPATSLGWFSDRSIDSLGSNNFLGCLMNPTQDSTVTNYYASDAYRELCEYAKEWQENGLFTEDALNDTGGAMDKLVSGMAAGMFVDSYSRDAMEIDNEASVGYDIIALSIGEPLATTGLVMNSNWCIASACKNPEAAMKVLNAMYSNKEIGNLLVNGIEGLTYKINENGQADYVDGQDFMSSGWTMQFGFFWPNKTNSIPFTPAPENYYETVLDSNKNCASSVALGFVFDNSAVADEITACTNVVAQYSPALMLGLVDYEVVLPEFLAALEDAGIDKIIAEKQTQLDAWLAGQK